MVPRKLAAQQPAPLLGDEARLGEAGVADHLLEADAIELAIRPLEGGIGGDLLGDLGVAEVESRRARARSSSTISETIWAITSRSRPSARAWSGR